MRRQSIYSILRRLADNTLPTSQRRDVLRWMTETPESAEKDEALLKIWDETDTTSVTDDETQDALRDVRRRLDIESNDEEPHEADTRRQRWTHAIMRYAAILLLPIITGLVVWGFMQGKVEESSEMAECYVPNGQQRTIQLPDGTQVTLNSGTLLVYPRHFNGSIRKVHLSGEGHFKVTHDKDMPFIVSSGVLNIKVLGTVFNVNAYPDDDDITTSLEEGCVNVFRSSDTEADGITMQPNERLVYNRKNGQFTLYRQEDSDNSSWTAGGMHFEQQPLSTILRTIERHYNVSIHCDSSLKLGDRYTFKFNRKETLGEVMHILTLVIGDTSYRIQGRNVLLTKKKGGTQL